MAPRATVKVWDDPEGDPTEIEIAEVVNYDADGAGRYAEVISTEGGRYLPSQHTIMIHA